MRTLKLFFSIIICALSFLYLAWYVAFLHITFTSLIALVCSVVFWKTLGFILKNKVLYSDEIKMKKEHKTMLIKLLEKI